MPDKSSQSSKLTPWQLALAWVLIALITWGLLKLLAPVLTPFVISLVLAYSLHPLVVKAHKKFKKLPRDLWVVIVEILFLLIVSCVLLLLVPILIKEIPLIIERLPTLAHRVNASIQPLLGQLGITYQLDPQNVKQLALTYLSDNSSDVWGYILPSLKVGGSLVLTVVGYVVLIPVTLFYLLADWDKVTGAAKRLIPPSRASEVQGFLVESDKVLGEYMRGQLSVMAILALFYSAGLALWGLDLALPIGVFTGLAMCIPYIGFGIGLLMALMAGVLQFELMTTALMLFTVYGVGQLIEGFYLTPKLVGERVGLHPLAVIFALLAFGQVFGFIGVLIALPASSVLLVALRRLRTKYFASDLYK